MKCLAELLLIAVLWGECSAQRIVTLSSPDGTNTIQFFPVSESIDNSTLSFSILRGKTPVILPSEIELSAEEIDFTSPYAIINVEENSIKHEWATEFGERKRIPDHYNQVKMSLESDTAKLKILARAYNEGVAFAYEVLKQSNLKTLHIKEELITYNFLDDFNVWATPKREPGVTTSKSVYNKRPISQLEPGCERPLLVDCGEIGVVARQKGKDWFIGGINGGTARKIKIDFSFLQNETPYIAKVYTDDELVSTRTRVKITEKELNSKSSMVLDVKANNGFAIHIRPIIE